MGRMKDLLITIYGGGDEAIEAAKQIAGLSDIMPHDDEPGWIPVGERLPEEGVEVLAWLPCDERACAGCVRDGYWCSPDIRLSDYPERGDPEGPTHWMPLPGPPAR